MQRRRPGGQAAVRMAQTRGRFGGTRCVGKEGCFDKQLSKIVGDSAERGMGGGIHGSAATEADVAYGIGCEGSGSIPHPGIGVGSGDAEWLIAVWNR